MILSDDVSIGEITRPADPDGYPILKTKDGYRVITNENMKFKDVQYYFSEDSIFKWTVVYKLSNLWKT